MMGTSPSAAEHDHEYEYCLLEEGRSSSWSPPPSSATAAGAAPRTPSAPPPRRRTPAWASAIRGFSNTLWLLIMVLFVVPMAMRLTNRDEVFICIFMFVVSFAFPLLGYVLTWDQP